MENQFCALLEGVLKYEQRSLGGVCALFVCAMIVIGIAMGVRFKKESVANRIVMVGIIAVLCAAFGSYLIVHHQDRAALRADLEQQTFVTYTGPLTHDDYQRDSFYHTVTIYPEATDEITLRYPDYADQYGLHNGNGIMPVGPIEGTVVYAENSGVIVDWRE